MYKNMPTASWLEQRSGSLGVAVIRAQRAKAKSSCSSLLLAQSGLRGCGRANW